MLKKNKIYELKGKIDSVFDELIQEGYIAEMNYACCRTCAFAELTDLAEDMEKDGKIVNGIVFYHNQGEDFLWKNGSVCLYYRAYNNDADAAYKEVGECIANKFREVGVNVEWDGNPNKAIKLYA